MAELRLSLLISEENIAERVRSLAQEIGREYEQKRPVLLGVGRGVGLPAGHQWKGLEI